MRIGARQTASVAPGATLPRELHRQVVADVAFVRGGHTAAGAEFERLDEAAIAEVPALVRADHGLPPPLVV